jgi:hypothetical protein
VRQRVQRVVHVGDRLALAIGLAGQIADRVVGVGLGQCRGEICIRDPAKRVVREEGRVRVGVSDDDMQFPMKESKSKAHLSRDAAHGARSKPSRLSSLSRPPVQHPFWGDVSYPIPMPKAWLFRRSTARGVNHALADPQRRLKGGFKTS